MVSSGHAREKRNGKGVLGVYFTWVDILMDVPQSSWNAQESDRKMSYSVNWRPIAATMIKNQKLPQN